MNKLESISLRRRPRAFRRHRVLALGCLGVLGLALSGMSAGASSGVPERTMTPVGTVPNAFGGSRLPNTTAVMADPANRLLFEYNATGSDAHPTCPYLVALDMDTYTQKAMQPCSDNYAFYVAAPAGGPLPPNLAIDPVDHVLLAVTIGQGDDRLDSLPGENGTEIMVLSEDTLHVLAFWSLPNTVAQRNIQGVSWYAPTDELVLLSASGGQGQSPPGVTVGAYDIKSMLAKLPPKPSTVGLTAVWSQLVTGCAYALSPSYNSAAAYHGDGAVYVPCQFVHGNDGPGLGVAVDGVVKIPVKGAGTSEAVSGNLVSAAAPGWSNDFYFDAAKDRGFMPLDANGRATALVYDGPTASFMGKIDLGKDEYTTPQTSYGGAIIGLDQNTGRIYALDADGLTLVDARRTPVAPGITLAQYNNPYVSPGSTVILPADAKYPYTRVLMPDITADSTSPGYTVYADTIPVTQDPPKAGVDNNTATGPIPPGATVTKLSGGNARGYGVHMDFVSGFEGVINNAEPFKVHGLPFGNGNRDLLGGFIDHVSSGNGALLAEASPLGDGNGSTSFDYQGCSNVYIPGNCASILNSSYCQPPVGPPLNPCPTPPVGPPSPPSNAPSTTQQWPFDAPSCYYNKQAQSGNATDSTSGAYGYDATGNKSPVPNSGGSAGSKVDCSGATVSAPDNQALATVGGAAQASSFVNAFQVDPVVQMASASSSGYVIPATDQTPAEASMHSALHGLYINVPGQGTLSIGSVEHDIRADSNGVAGSAVTSNKVTISQVRLQSATMSYSCDQCNPQAVFDQINSAFPYVMHAFAPKADAPFGFAADSVSPNGSPGGYAAVVQADGAQQFGDQQFNDMRAEEASMLPGFRIVIYGVNDGTPNLSRLVIDAAGGEVDTETGLQVQSAFGGDGAFSTAPNVALAAIDAGVPSGGTGGGSNTSPGGVGGNNGAGRSGGTPGGGLLGVVQSTLSGVAWLARSPGAAIQMGAFLTMLGLPLVMLRRRWAPSVEQVIQESKETSR